MQSKTYIQTSRSYTSPSKGNLGWKEVPMPKIIQTRPSSNEDVSSGKYYYRTIKKIEIMIIKKILVFFICSIVPYISKGQCLDSLKSVCLPDSIAEQIENSYEDKYTNASKNVVNLISPNNYNLVDGIYAFKGMGPHFPRQIFVYKREKIFIFNSRGDYNPEGVIMEFCSCFKKLNLTHKEIVDYLNVICLYLQEEEVTDYGDTIK